MIDKNLVTVQKLEGGHYGFNGVRVYYDGKYILCFGSEYFTCAISPLTDLPLDKTVENLYKLYTKEELIDIIGETFYKICNETPKDKRYTKAHLILSNVSGKKINSILDKVCQTKTKFVKNINSGNKVKTWIYSNPNKNI